MSDLNGKFPNISLNLELLAEECIEVIQIKSKVARFGMEGISTVSNESNRESLEKEVGDLLAIVDILLSNGVLTEEGLSKAKEAKFKKLSLFYG